MVYVYSEIVFWFLHSLIKLQEFNLILLKSGNNMSEYKISFKSLNLDGGLYVFINLALQKSGLDN